MSWHRRSNWLCGVMCTLLINFFSSPAPATGLIIEKQSLDEITWEIFQTPIMQQQLSILLNCQVEAVQAALGLPRALAIRLIAYSRKTCPKIIRSEVLPFTRSVEKNRIYIPESAPAPAWSLWSWTSNTNETSIYINEIFLDRPDAKTLRTRLAQIIIHEFAIFFDSKQRLDLGRHPPKWFRSGQPSPDKKAFEILENLNLRLTLASIRALQVEEEVLPQLAHQFPDKYSFSSSDYNLSGSAKTNNASCILLVKKILRESGNHIMFLARHQALDLFAEKSLNELLAPNGLVNEMKSTSLSFPHGPIPLCVEYARPALSNQNMSFSIGPRGRSGGAGSGD